MAAKMKPAVLDQFPRDEVCTSVSLEFISRHLINALGYDGSHVSAITVFRVLRFD
jgi:hypothetical protein